MNGKELREWRELMGWSQEQAATAVDETRRTYQEMEASAKPVSQAVTTATTIFRALKCPGGGTDRKFLDLTGLSGVYQEKMRAVDAMGKDMGRPKKDLYLAAVDEFIDIMIKFRGHLINAANNAEGSIPRTAFTTIIQNLDGVAEAREKARQADAANAGPVVNRRIPRPTAR